MKSRAAVIGGAIGGAIAGVMVAAAGHMLDFALWPWLSYAPYLGYIARAQTLGHTMAVLVPVGAALGVGAAFVCALVLEYVTGGGGWAAGAVVGASLGIAGAALLGLMPWAAAWFGYAYTPIEAPLGPHDPAWAMAAVAASGLIAGAIAAAWYGAPVHASKPPPRFRWRQVYPP